MVFLTLFILFRREGGEIGRQRDTQKQGEAFHPLIHSPDAYRGPTWVSETKLPEPSFGASQGL